jgi:hypothetical protein
MMAAAAAAEERPDMTVCAQQMAHHQAELINDREIKT